MTVVLCREAEASDSFGDGEGMSIEKRFLVMKYVHVYTSKHFP